MGRSGKDSEVAHSSQESHYCRPQEPTEPSLHRSPFIQVAPERSVPERFAPVRSAPVKSALERIAFERFDPARREYVR